jgi:hypothetical protein
MDPTTLIGPSDPLGFPAPFWFVEFFKVLGFTLHTVPMNLWYAGLVLAAIFGLFGSTHPRRLAHRLITAMPVVVALGVNLGIVPLLFTQVAYYKVFYPAGVLMAWPWFSVIVLLTLAYYGVYLYATSVRRDWRPRLGLAAGWVSAILFVSIGFLFANNFSLMTNVAGWPALLHQTGVAGAPTGIALNTADPTLWPRWLMMFGLALTTVAAYIVVDTAFFAGQESDDYRRWAATFAPKLATLGLVWFAITGSWYIFGTLRADVRGVLLGVPWLILTVLTALGPGLPWLLIMAQRQGITRRFAVFTALAQFGVLALNAVSRQFVQNAELGTFLNVAAEPVNTQWSPMIVFLVLFVVGLGIVTWMLSKVIAVAGKPSAQAR